MTDHLTTEYETDRLTTKHEIYRLATEHNVERLTTERKIDCRTTKHETDRLTTEHEIDHLATEQETDRGKRGIILNLTKLAKRNVGGSFTLEAAFIMPFVIFILIGFIFLAYSMYDRCRIEETIQNQFLSANRWALHETDLSTDEFLYHRLNERSVFWGLSGEYEEFERYLEERLESNKEPYFRTELSDVDFVLENDGITLNYTEVRNIPEFLFRFFGETTKLKSRDEGFHCPAEFTRKYTVFHELIRGNQKLSDLKERLLMK